MIRSTGLEDLKITLAHVLTAGKRVAARPDTLERLRQLHCSPEVGGQATEVSRPAQRNDLKILGHIFLLFCTLS